jgi:hypothetical protein
VTHAHARLTFHGRCLLVRRVVHDLRPVAHVAKELGVSRQCAHRWVARFRAERWDGGLHDCSSRTRTRTRPRHTPAYVEAAVLSARRARSTCTHHIHAGQKATAPLSPTLRAPRATKRLQQRQHRRVGAAIRAADQWPAHYVAFDLLRVGTDLTTQPYRGRRAALETLFSDHQLQAPWPLCPSTIDSQQATVWLAWSSVGLEGLVFKRLDQAYLPLAGERGAGTGPVTPLRPWSARSPGPQPPPRPRCSAASTTAATSSTPAAVQPVVVAEVGVDVALDMAGRWRHPVRPVRVRPDLTPDDVPLFGRLRHRHGGRRSAGLRREPLSVGAGSSTVAGRPAHGCLW